MNLEKLNAEILIGVRRAIEDFHRGLIFATSHLLTGKHDEAMKDLNKALQLDGNLANAYNFRGLVLMSGDGKETESRAATDFRTGCEKGDPDACKNLKQLEKSLEPAPAK